MDIREICAEKIRAASQRARYRDFYDLYLILTTYQFDLIEIHSLIQRKEVRSPITHEAMVANWQIAKGGKAGDLRSIYCTKQVSNQDIETLITKLSFPPVLPTSG